MGITMIRKYKWKDWSMPIRTDAIVVPVEYTEEGKLPFLKTQFEENSLSLTYTMEQEDRVYGLGQQLRGINKRGWIYESYCKDDPNHTEDKHSLYGAHNFFIVKGKESFGCFIDCGGKVIFDIGYENQNILNIETKEPCEVYIVTGNTINDIIKQFRCGIGRSYIPPKWAFGYQQSRWGYNKKQDIEKVAEEHKKRNIPLEAVYMDIDYMERFKDFTIDENKFPEFSEFAANMIKQHIHLVPIIDAGVKIEDGYEVYETGKDKYFCKDKNGKDFVGGVWPGLVSFPDFMNQEVRNWFSSFYKDLLDMGIEGFWNDMNEPALFYSQEGLKEVYEKAGKLDWNNFRLDDFLELQPLVNQLGGNEEDFKKIYHNINGNMVRHDKVHNLYGYFMVKAAMEKIEKERPDKRILLFARASYIGMHRYSGIWTGDNKSWWSHLLLNIKMMPSLSMCGFLYAGADIGGFDGDVTEDLLTRWLEFGIFTPLLRNHCALGRRNQEIYQYESWKKMKELICLRYRLIPYLYSEFMKSALLDEMFFSPLSFIYSEDKQAEEIEDQLIVGDSIMIAPIYEQNKSGRIVYFPEDMLMLRFETSTHYVKEKVKKGYQYISMPQGEAVFFVRKNHIFILGEGGKYVDEACKGTMTILGWFEKETSYLFYEDDGYSKEYNKNNFETWSVIKRTTLKEDDWNLKIQGGRQSKKYLIEKDII